MTEVRDWQDRAEGLADLLTADGDLHDPRWRVAVCDTPRHEFVPHYYEPTAGGTTYERVVPHDDATRAVWLDKVYSDTTLITAVLPDTTGRHVPVSSSTKPDLMIRMLEALDIHDGHKVLEIGTGTGYNAALLSHRLGADRVFSIDLRPDLVQTARQRLAAIGHHPSLRAGNGNEGMADNGPFNRIIATCSVPAIPPAWIEQLAPGGTLLVDVEGQLSAGNLIALHRPDDTPRVQGRFLDWYGRFMALRHTTTDVGDPRPTPDHSEVRERTTGLNPAELDHEFRLLAQFRLPPGIHHTLTVKDGNPSQTHLTGRDGSWCAIDRTPDRAGRHRLRHGGPRDLWTDVEAAHRDWTELGTPAWHHFGITATPTVQRLWYDHPDHPQSWNLTL